MTIKGLKEELKSRAHNNFGCYWFYAINKKHEIEQFNIYFKYTNEFKVYLDSIKPEAKASNFNNLLYNIKEKILYDEIFSTKEDAESFAKKEMEKTIDNFFEN